MWLYLLPLRTWTSGTYDEGMDEGLRDNHILPDVNLITKIVEFNIKGLADPRSCKVQEMTNLHPEKVGRALRKPRG